MKAFEDKEDKASDLMPHLHEYIRLARKQLNVFKQETNDLFQKMNEKFTGYNSNRKRETYDLGQGLQSLDEKQLQERKDRGDNSEIIANAMEALTERVEKLENDKKNKGAEEKRGL